MSPAWATLAPILAVLVIVAAGVCIALHRELALARQRIDANRRRELRQQMISDSASGVEPVWSGPAGEVGPDRSSPTP